MEEESKYYLINDAGDKLTSSRGVSGSVTIFYDNGDIYEGNLLEGVREGRGIYRYKETKHLYDGGWEDNLRSGLGRMEYFGRGDYHGYWENGRRHGEGTFKYKNGDVYSGWWKYGEK